MSSLVDAAKKRADQKRLYTKLGIDRDSLLTNSSKSGGYMKSEEYKIFWSQVDDPAGATWLIGEIAAQIVKIIDTHVKGGAPAGGNNNNMANANNAAMDASNGGPVPFSLDSLLTTFNFALFTLETLTADKKIKEGLASWAKVVDAVQNNNKVPQHPLFEQCKEVFRLLTLRTENHEWISTVILRCISMYGSAKEFERIMEAVNYSTIDDSVDLKGGESSFYFEHLKRLAKDGIAIPNTTTIGKTPMAPGESIPPGTALAPQANPQLMLQNMLQNIVSKIQSLPQQMKLNPILTGTSFCALFHLFRNFMSTHAVTDPVWLRSTLSQLQPFYLWPQPYGGQTRELLIQLQEELLLPGSFMRARLEQEVNCVPYQEEGTSSGSSSTGTPGELTSPLFYIYSQDDKVSQAYINILDPKPFKVQSVKKSPSYASSENVLLTPVTQALTLLNLLACESTFSAGMEEDVAAMRNCNADQVYAIYRRSQQMIREILERPNDSKAIRTRGLTEIRQQIRAAAAASDKRDLVRLPEKLVSPFTPPLPPLSHLSLSMKSTSVFEFEARDQWRMVGHKTAPFVTVPIVEELSTLFQMYRDPMRARPMELRIMISGSDELLHQVVCAWCSIKQTKSEILDGLIPRFYLLPFSKNHLSAFLARHDAWYNRHIYVPCRSACFMTPWVRMQDEGGNSSGGGARPHTSAQQEEEGAELQPPGQFFRKTCESYAREAPLQFQTNLYQLEGFLTPDSEGLKPINPGTKTTLIPGPDQLIPFVQRVEIGVMASAAEFKRARKLAESVRLEDIVSGSAAASKGFDYQPIELNVKFTKLDLQGRLSEVVSEDATVYQSLVVSNVPRKSDLPFPPNPSYPQLELGARLHKAHNIQKNTNLGRKNTLALDSRQHVIEVELSSANPAQTFGVCIDNQLFGPYCRVKILPAFETGNSGTNTEAATKRITFPIQQFFPMDM